MTEQVTSRLQSNRREFIASPKLELAATIIASALQKQMDRYRRQTSYPADTGAAKAGLSSCINGCDWRPNFAFANRYADGSENVSWHSDHLTTLGPRPIIVGLSLGACRRFEFRQQPSAPPSPNATKTSSHFSTDGDGMLGKESVPPSLSSLHVSIPMPHNSVIIMHGDSQETWQHAIPKCSSDSILQHAKSGLVRISLTFRMKRHDMPDLGLCYCGRPAGLKAKNGRYFLMCQPYGNPDKQKTCPYWKPSNWANEEAARLMMQNDLKTYLLR